MVSLVLYIFCNNNNNNKSKEDSPGEPGTHSHLEVEPGTHSKPWSPRPLRGAGCRCHCPDLLQDLPASEVDCFTINPNLKE